MIHGDPLKLEPYRVEWRPFLTSGWVLMRSCLTHDEALGEMADAYKAHKGQVRIVTQHVTEVKGLGA